MIVSKNTTELYESQEVIEDKKKNIKEKEQD
jgi:hypothetical protein